MTDSVDAGAISPTTVTAAATIVELKTASPLKRKRDADAASSSNGVLPHEKEKEKEKDGVSTETEPDSDSDDDDDEITRGFKAMTVDERIQSLKTRLKNIADGKVKIAPFYFQHADADAEEDRPTPSPKRRKRAVAPPIAVKKPKGKPVPDPRYRNYDDEDDRAVLFQTHEEGEKEDTSIGLAPTTPSTNKPRNTQCVVWEQEKKWKTYTFVPKTLVIGRGRLNGKIYGTGWVPNDVVTMSHDKDLNPHIRARWNVDWVFKFPQWQEAVKGDGDRHFEIIRIMQTIHADEFNYDAVSNIVRVLKKGGCLQIGSDFNNADMPAIKMMQKALQKHAPEELGLLEYSYSSRSFEAVRL